MNSHEEEARRRLSQLSPEALWNIADLRFSFRDDAPADTVESANLTRRIACELTGYQEFYDRPTPPLPSEPLWYLGNGRTPAYEELQTKYPGIVCYLSKVSSHPPRVLWCYVARFDLWAAFEGLLQSAAASGHVIEDWWQVERVLLAIAVREHLNTLKSTLAQGASL